MIIGPARCVDRWGLIPCVPIGSAVATVYYAFGPGADAPADRLESCGVKRATMVVVADEPARAAQLGRAVDSTEIASQGPGLRSRLETDGYVVVRHVLPIGDVGALAAELAAGLRESRLIAPDDLVPAPADAGPSASAASPAARSARGFDLHADRCLYRSLYSLERLHRLPHHPALTSLAAALLGSDADGASSDPLLVHPRPALRIVFPGTPGPLGATPAHQDHLGMQGSTEVVTIWIALSECPIEAGVLSVAAGSHRQGQRPYRAVRDSRVAGCDESGLDGRWVATPLGPGDVLAFHSLTVHRALPNVSGRVRLSVDARYQRAAEPVCDASLREPPDISWDDLYAGWEDGGGELRRYWERFELEVVPFDPGRFVDPGGSAAGAG